MFKLEVVEDAIILNIDIIRDFIMFKLEVVEDAIILNIDIIRDIKHLRPSAQIFFETINKDPGFEGILNIEQFKDAMDSLEKEGIIYLSGKKGGKINMSYFVDKSKLATRNSIEASSFLSHDLISEEEFIESKFNALICEVVKKEVSDQLKAFNFTQERNSTSNNNNLVSNLQSEISK